MSDALTARNADIVTAIRSGETLAAVGLRYGLTRERVRQIFDRDTGETNFCSARADAKKDERQYNMQSLAEGGLHKEVIAEALGVSPQTIYKYSREIGVDLPRNPEHQAVYYTRAGEVVEWHAAGVLWKEIVRRLYPHITDDGMWNSYAMRIKHDLGLPDRSGFIPPHETDAVLEAYASGASTGVIAAKYGIKPASVVAFAYRHGVKRRKRHNSNKIPR
jgi:uncharacterized protein (DUF433 family)